MAPNMHKIDHVKDIIKDDQTGRDERLVDDLLSKEMLGLSLEKRNDIQEEIHGVKCLAIEETQELIQKSLQELNNEIDRNIPNSQKRAYLQSLEHRHQQQQQLPLPQHDPLSNTNRSRNIVPLQTPSPNEHTNNNNNPSYIHGNDFRLRFLRCELFNVPKAAQRLVTYLDMLVEIFGNYALERPICLSDFTKEELRHMRKGMIQTLPYRDRSGRRIMIAFPEEDVSQIPPFVKAKIAMYMLWTAGDNDPVTQKLGIVVLVWFDGSFAKLSTSWKIKYKFYTLNCDRITAIHCCSPDTSHYRFRRSIMVMRCGVENRSKLNFHLGESMEIHYKLQGYGIPFEHIPISWTGKVKVQYLKQWMRIRQAIEEQNKTNGSIHKGSNSSSSSGDWSSDETTTVASSSSSYIDIIECPQLQDVVFRQGTSGISHPGNAIFRSLIESIVSREQFRQYEVEQKLVEQRKEIQIFGGPSKSSSSIPSQKKPYFKRPKHLALDIYEERQRTSSSTCRFLVWNNDKGWWNKITDKEQICMKIEYMVREFQKLTPKKNTRGIGVNKKKASNSTNRKTPVFDNDEIPRYHQNRPVDEVGSSSSTTTSMIYLQSGTSLFREHDNSGTTTPLFFNKRQRLEFCGGHHYRDISEGSNSNNASPIDFGQTKNECFGMNFAPCLS